MTQKTSLSLSTWITAIAAVLIVVLGLVYVVSRDNNRPVKNTDIASSTIFAIKADDHVKGNPASKIILVEYSDFQCPACALYSPITDRIAQDYKEQIQFVYRHYPLPQHKNAKVASYAAEAAGKQGKFFEMGDIIFSKQNDWTSSIVPETLFEQYALSLGLNMDQFKKDSISKEVKDRVARDYTEGTNIPITATPSFFLNGAFIKNPQNYQQFKEVIENAIRNS